MIADVPRGNIPPADPVAAARAEVDRLAQTERDLAARSIECRARLAELEASSGDVVLDATLSGSPDDAIAKTVGDVARLRAEIEALERSSDAARRRRRLAIPAVWAAEAEGFRARAALLRSEADEREPKTRRLLDELAAWEGVEYVPAGPRRDSRVDANLPGAGGVIFVPTPRTALLRQEADRLDAQAAELAARQPGRNGTAEADDVDGLLVALMADPMRVGPAIAEARAWAMTATATLTERRRRVAARGEGALGYVAPGGPIHLTLQWRDDAIVPAESFAG